MVHLSTKTSEQVQSEAMAIAKSRQKKEQTKLIAQGIEKGISEYKKQQKIKARERDKLRKKQANNKEKELREHEKPHQNDLVTTSYRPSKQHYLPWGLLVLSWGYFAFYWLS